MNEFEEKELVVTEVEQRNWKGILISLLVIVSICSLILLSIFILSPHFGIDTNNKRLTVDDLLTNGTKSYRYNGSWLSERELLFIDIHDSLVVYNIDTKYKSILVDGINLRTNNFSIKKFSVSADRRYLLLSNDMIMTGSHSYIAKYTVYDTKSHIGVPLVMPDSSEYLQHAGWAPNANQLIVIHKNNIYFYFRIGDQPIQITTNGREGFIYNGIPDLMYEEHILKTHLTYWWLNDGSRLCYASFDNTLVDQMPYIIYGATNASSQSRPLAVGGGGDNDYPKVYTYPYPKPGREISKVTLTVVDISAPNYVRARTQVIPPDEIRGWDHYITAPVVWITKTSIAVVWSRRSQNYTVVSICKEETNWVCNKLIEEQLSGPKGWLMVDEGPVFSDDKKYMFMRLPVADGTFGTYDHIAMIYTESGKKYFLTHGQFVVTKIFAYRSDLHTLYFAATVYNDPGSRHIFSVTDMNSLNPRKIECLSCNASEKCWFNNAIFSPNGRYYVSECLGPEIPTIHLLSVDENKFIETLDTTAKLRTELETKMMPKIKYLTIPNDKGPDIRVELILPQSLIEDEDTKYPAVIEINNLPNTQSVNYEYRLDWSRYLTSKKDYITIHIDGRGTGYQGNRHMFEVIGELGKEEIHDLKIAINYLKKKLPYIDEDKIVVWGRDYGGFITMSLLATTEPTTDKKHPNMDMVTCAIAVTPISNWKNYLSVFSERYIGQPYSNYDINYQNSRLTQIIEQKHNNLKKKTFLLVHGTSDKRVNIDHTMLLMKELTDKSIQFKVQLYPDSGIIESWERSVRKHFYLTMEDFFAKCFQVEDQEEALDLINLTPWKKNAPKV